MEDLLVQIEMEKFQKGGCIFCSERGSGEHLKTKSIPEQVKEHLESYRGQRANKFIVYFQNFTNTYDTIQNLKQKYDSSLIDDRIVGIDIATRPDCINGQVVELLKSYKEKYYVSVELGLQTANDNTAKILNRGYNLEIFTKAVKMLNEAKIDVVIHIMLGLPNETKEDLIKTVNYLNTINYQGIKIHSTYVVKGTVLEKLYNENKYTPITLNEYLEQLTYVLTHIKKDIVIHRITGDAPKDKLVAPEWNIHKKWILNGIEKIMKENNLYQGCKFDV